MLERINHKVYSCICICRLSLQDPSPDGMLHDQHRAATELDISYCRIRGPGNSVCFLSFVVPFCFGSGELESTGRLQQPD